MLVTDICFTTLVVCACMNVRASKLFKFFSHVRRPNVSCMHVSRHNVRAVGAVTTSWDGKYNYKNKRYFGTVFMQVSYNISKLCHAHLEGRPKAVANI
jgi:hypothetical protein